MKRLTLPVVGSGTDGDPFRVNLPTYQLVSVSDDGKFHTVDVPDDDVPDDVNLGPSVPLGPRLRQLDVRRASPLALAAWYAHLDERYQEHRGRFRPKGS